MPSQETSGGDNEALAKKIHARYDRAGVKQAAVQIRYDDLNVDVTVPEGAQDFDALFTVGLDMMIKVFVRTACRHLQPALRATLLALVSTLFQ